MIWKKSEPNFWLSCMLIDPKCNMRKQVRGEQEALYLSEHGKGIPYREILEAIMRYSCRVQTNMETYTYVRLSNEQFYNKGKEMAGAEPMHIWTVASKMLGWIYLKEVFFVAKTIR